MGFVVAAGTPGHHDDQKGQVVTIRCIGNVGAYLLPDEAFERVPIFRFGYRFAGSIRFSLKPYDKFQYPVPRSASLRSPVPLTA